MIFAANQRQGKRLWRLLSISAALASWPIAFAALAADPAPAHPAGVIQSVAGDGTPAVVLDDNRVESLLGKEVSGAGGEKLGRIVDVLVGRAGELRAAVVDFGGFLGVGTRKVAVAWSTLTFGDNGPVLAMTAEELRVTPEYRAGEPVVVVGAPKSPAEHTTRAGDQAAPSSPSAPPEQ